MSQTNAGHYLRGDKAGTLDLDEAADALEHAGSSLAAFIAGSPVRELSETDRLARALVGRPELADLVKDLLPIGQKRLGDVIELIRGLARVATTRRDTRTPGSGSAPNPARRTTKARAKRR